MKKALFTLAAIAAFVATTTAAETSVTMTTVTATSAAATTATTTSVTTTTAAATSVTATTAAAANAPQDGAGATMPENNGVAWFIVLPALVVCVLAIAAIWRSDLIKTNRLLAGSVAGGAGIAFFVGVGALFGQITPGIANITMVHLITFVGAWATFIFFAIRTDNFNKQIKLQTEQLKLQIGKEIDDRFHSAVQLLGNAESSARTGAIYSLYHLATEHGKYRNQIAQILCSHIRSKTEEDVYRKQYSIMPSNEIQTAINLLFRDVNGTVGLYKNIKISAELPKPNLSHSYLVGARFWGANCQGGIFLGANCIATNFHYSECQGALFYHGQLTSAWFTHASLQGVNFEKVNCQFADFGRAKCQGANFSMAKCQGADFSQTKCQGANFSEASCQGADFSDAECQGAYAETTAHNALNLSERIASLMTRIGKPTEIHNAVFSGEIDAESVQAIKRAEEFLIHHVDNIQQIIATNKGKPISYEMPKNSGIITGVLKNSEEMQKIFAMLWDIDSPGMNYRGARFAAKSTE